MAFSPTPKAILESVESRTSAWTLCASMAKWKTPFKDLLPPLSTDERNALKDDIKQDGVRDSILVDEDGNILEGHNRYAIDKNAPHKVIKGLSDAQKKAFVIRANLSRRNLSPAQRKDVLRTCKKIAKELKAEDKGYWTDARIGKELGVAKTTVASWFTTKSSDGLSCKRSPSESSRQKIDPKVKPEIVARVESGENQTQVAADYKVSQQAISKIVNEESAKAEKKKERQKAAKSRKGNNGVIHGDFRKGAAEPDSYDLIFTDPPYDIEAVELYESLAEHASKTLVKGGWLLAYAGQSFLPDIYAAFSKHLTYAWTFAALHSGGDTRIRKYRIQNGWKPIIAAYRPPLSVDWEWFKDVVTGGKEKGDHEWQQPEREAAYFIERLCPAKGIVFDPFCGSGTTLAAAKSLGRRWIGFEIDKDHVETARHRLDGK